MNLKLFCAIERVNNATISPAQSKDCQVGLQIVVRRRYFSKKSARTTTHVPGLTHLGPEPKKVIWVCDDRFCCRNSDQMYRTFFRQPMPRRGQNTERVYRLCREFSGDEIKRRGNLRWRGNLRSGCLGLGSGLLTCSTTRRASYCPVEP